MAHLVSSFFLCYVSEPWFGVIVALNYRQGAHWVLLFAWIGLSQTNLTSPGSLVSVCADKCKSAMSGTPFRFTPLTFIHGRAFLSRIPPISLDWLIVLNKSQVPCLTITVFPYLFLWLLHLFGFGPFILYYLLGTVLDDWTAIATQPMYRCRSSPVSWTQVSSRSIYVRASFGFSLGY